VGDAGRCSLEQAAPAAPGRRYLVPATASHSSAIATTLERLTPRGKLRIVAAALEPMQLPVLPLLGGKSVARWPSDTAVDSEDTLDFGARSGVHPRVETSPLEHAEEAYTRSRRTGCASGEVRVP